ncbi:MAG: hypothetical protein K6T76_09410 [Alicyclobacillus mali]|uniref:hypothetical protein n=1 Tax=Alicyclobacillus mali (ex Roth et al. 2021) TaxID=1123961 RepID=UPI0023F4A3A4|nr:hypothetical protein [Alicyclobacillus mali (ex Roth et al. 2021)]MCL6489138.1 hypothetical protein [Alicyclobacillus mali (ex Roth et al. 2021)]
MFLLSNVRVMSWMVNGNQDRAYLEVGDPELMQRFTVSVPPTPALTEGQIINVQITGVRVTKNGNLFLTGVVQTGKTA